MLPVRLRAVNDGLDAAQAKDVARRRDEDGHLVAVIRPIDGGPVNCRSPRKPGRNHVPLGVAVVVSSVILTLSLLPLTDRVAGKIGAENQGGVQRVDPSPASSLARSLALDACEDPHPKRRRMAAPDATSPSAPLSMAHWVMVSQSD